MYGTVKYYNQQKCYGFIGTSDGKEYFFHISGLNKNYSGKPNADDNVEFKVSEPNDKGSICAYNIKPILTLNIVRKALGKEHLHLKSMKDEYGNRRWLVLDDNNAIQTSDKGMSLEEVWDYINDCQELLDDSMKYPCGC